MATEMEVKRNNIMDFRDREEWKKLQKLEKEGLHGFFLFEAKLEIALDEMNGKKNIKQMFGDNKKVDVLKNDMKEFAAIVQTALEDNNFEFMKEDIKLVWAKSLVFLRDRRLGIKFFHQINEPPLTARLRTLALYAELSFIQVFTIIKDVHMKIKFRATPNAWWFVLNLIRKLNEKACACLGKTVARAEKPLTLPPIVWRRSDYMLGVAAYLRGFEQNSNSMWPFYNDDSTNYLESIRELSDDYFQILHFKSTEAHKQSQKKIEFLSAIHEPAETIIHLAAAMQDTLNNFDDFYLLDLAIKLGGTLSDIINYHLNKKLDSVSSLAVPKVENDGGEVKITELDGQGSPITSWSQKLLTEIRLLKQKPLEGISLYLLDTLALPTTTWKECITSASGTTAEHVGSCYTVAIDRDEANDPMFIQEAEFLKILLKVFVCGDLDGEVGNLGSNPPHIVFNP